MFNQRFLISFTVTKYVCRRLSDYMKEKFQTGNDLLWKTIERGKIKSVQDWKNIRNEILNNAGLLKSVTSSNIDAITMGICTSKKEYDLALSYFSFLESEQIKPNLATLGKYFKLLFLKALDEGLTPESEKQILTLYNDVRKAYPVLDALTLENIIQAISLTSEWKKGVDLLNETKITAPPGPTSYNAVIAAAFLNYEDNLAWKLLDEMLEQDKVVQGIVYTSFINRASKASKRSEILKELETMFQFIHKYSLKIKSATVDDLVELFKKINVPVHTATVTQRGICRSCKTKLKSFDLSVNEFNKLKSKIFQNVIVGKDVFHRTSPDELKKFKNFVSTMESFDVVVDGLNVAYSSGVQHSPVITSGLVASVVSHFVNQGKKVLVLGRSHMNKWPKQNWGYVLQNATVFLTQDLSQDDPYILYCAVNSGKDTIVITRDLMRGHKFLLRNGHLKLLFDRWFSLRQYQLVRVSETGTPIFKRPMEFSNIAQKNDGYWHVPYTIITQNKSSEASAWLCIQC